MYAYFGVAVYKMFFTEVVAVIEVRCGFGGRADLWRGVYTPGASSWVEAVFSALISAGLNCRQRWGVGGEP